jgi:hypothetical protein
MVCVLCACGAYAAFKSCKGAKGEEQIPRTPIFGSASPRTLQLHAFPGSERGCTHEDLVRIAFTIYLLQCASTARWQQHTACVSTLPEHTPCMYVCMYVCIHTHTHIIHCDIYVYVYYTLGCISTQPDHTLYIYISTHTHTLGCVSTA